MTKTSREVNKGSHLDNALKIIMKKKALYDGNGMKLRPLSREIISGKQVKYQFEVVELNVWSGV